MASRYVCEVERSGLAAREGQKLSYELQRDEHSGKMSAIDLQVATGADCRPFPEISDTS